MQKVKWLCLVVIGLLALTACEGAGAQPTPTPASMTSDSGSMMGGHSMEPISDKGAQPATQERGGQPLTPRLVGAVKVFDLTTKVVKWKILDNVTATAMTYNGTVPGPLIRVTEGDTVRVVLKNELNEPTTIHWHGIDVPNAMDGVPDLTQAAVKPGETFTYEFVAKPAGTFMYHSHVNSDVQVLAGLYAPFIIDPKTPTTKVDVDVPLMLSEWRVVSGKTYSPMPMSGMEPNFFSINGKAYPSTEPINAKAGQRVRIRFMGIGQFIHPMHLHGMPFTIVETDGHPVPLAAQWTKDTVSVAPGERYAIEFTAVPGKWMLHCHIPHHMTNDGVEPGGLILVVNVSE